MQREIQSTHAEACRNAATLIAESARESIAQRGEFSIALAGGSTPKNVYALLADKTIFPDIDWPKWRVFFTDERCVPSDDVESNYRMVSEMLLSKVGICPNCVHRMEVELTSVPAADMYAQAMHNHFGADGRFDFILLGMGGDGHTASLFPSTEALDENDAWCFGNEVPQLDTERVTLTFPAINAARRVMFLVTGASKADTLARVFNDERNVSELPAQGVCPTDGELIWVLDEAVAAGIG